MYIPHFAVRLNKQCCDHQLVSGTKDRNHLNKQKNCPRWKIKLFVLSTVIDFGTFVFKVTVLPEG